MFGFIFFVFINTINDRSKSNEIKPKENIKKIKDDIFPDFFCENFQPTEGYAKGDIMDFFTTSIDGPFTEEKLDTLNEVYYYGKNINGKKITQTNNKFSDALIKTESIPFYTSTTIKMHPEDESKNFIYYINFMYREPENGWTNQIKSYSIKQLFDNGLYVAILNSELSTSEFSIEKKSDIDKLTTRFGSPTRLLGYEYYESDEDYKTYSYYLCWDYEGYSILIPVKETGYAGADEIDAEYDTEEDMLYIPAASLTIEEDYRNW